MMCFRKLLIAMALAISVGSTEALADNTIAVLLISPGAGPDTRPCTFFQVTGSSQWYGVPASDPNYTAELTVLTAAFLPGPGIGQPISFGVGDSQSCGLPQAYDIAVGNFQ